MSITTRIAPTPSGYLHRGNAYNFCLAWLLARANKGTIWLRIDDLDQGRFRPRFLDSIFSDLEWLGLDWDQGPMSVHEAARFSQYTRLDLYHSALAQLENQSNVFGCSCSRKKIRQTSEDGQYPGHCLDVRPRDKLIWKLWTKNAEDVRLNGQYFPLQERAVILQNRQGIPSYPLACVIDDETYQIDTIVRGNDLWNTSLTQQYLRNILGFSTVIQHIHHPLILDHEGRKLSKSSGSLPISTLRESHEPMFIWRDFAVWRGWNEIPSSPSEILPMFMEQDPLYTK